MPNQNPTLLQVVRERLDASVDPDSDGGQILNSLTLVQPLAPGALNGKASAEGLTLAPTATGVSVRAAANADTVVLNYPIGTYDFALVSRDAAHPDPQVELTLIPIVVPLPSLHPAHEISPDTLQPLTGNVALELPPLLLVITATETTPSSARLSPFHGGVPEIPVTIKPEFASIDQDCVVGFHLQTATIKLGDAPEVLVDKLKLYIAPPGMPALNMSGGVKNLHIGLGAGTGLTGDFNLPLADGEGTAARPRFLHKMEAQLHLNNGSVTLLELSGEIGLSEQVHSHFSTIDATPDAISYKARLHLDPDWEMTLSLSGSGAENFLWRKARADVGAVGVGALDTLGAFLVLSPVLKPVATAAVSSVAAAHFFTTESITLVGGELQIFKDANRSREGRLFFEIETELTVDIPGLIKSSRSMKVRHKALGVNLNFGPDGDAPQFQPIIDEAQGFGLDLSDPGLFDLGNLGDLLKPDGARIAKENPLFFEVDLVPKANLGVVTIDRASVRVPLDSPNAQPSLTALGAHLDAGLITGGGYLKILPEGFEGRLDVSLGMLGVRGSARLKLLNKSDFIALGAQLEVVWPVPIPLANSGLGLFGLVGLFAMHLKRQLNRDETTMAWFLRAHGDPSQFGMWEPNKGQWAFGAGAVLGTLEGGFIIHAKGMLMIELPGPRILIVMNADILKARPGVKGIQELATVVALIEIAPHALTIAIVLDYHELKPLLEVRIPVEAFFNLKDGEDWHLNVGGIPPEKRVLVKFLETFRADGYFLIHGNGISDFKPPLYGFAIAVGVHVAFTWGPKAIGLYMTVVFEGDLGIGFKPFLLAGKAGIRGELHLFILSLGISATAEVLIAESGWEVKAEVCARVEFLFFEVEGCVTLELGEPPPLPNADPLASALSLHTRPPALLVGSATAEQPVDGSLGNAFHFDGHQFVGDPGQDHMPEVPIDAIPVLQLEMRPGADPACEFFDEHIHGLIPSDPTSQPLTVKGVPGPGWLKRGNRFYHYRLKSVELTRVLENGTLLLPTLTEGHPDSNLTPITWWDRRGAPSPGVDNEVQLALLTWQVDPTPAAAERTSSRDEILKRRWGNICRTVVESSHILWTFRDVAVGPSASGWTLTGVAHRDPADIARAGRLDVTMQVSEPWRSPDPIANSLVRVESAYVFGSSDNAGRVLIAPHTGLEPEPRQPDDPDFIDYVNLHPLPSLEGLANALRLNTHGLTWVRVLLFADEGRYQNGELVLRLRDEQGQIMDDRKIDQANSRSISTQQELFDIWGDFEPWLPLVDSAWTAWQDNVRGLPIEQLSLILLETDLIPAEADPHAAPYQIDIGMIVDGLVDQGVVIEKWGVLAVEAETAAERARVDFDNAHREDETSAVNGALHADQSKRALLIPNSLYEVEVTYEVAKAPSDDHGNPMLDAPEAKVEPLHTQRFRFKTQPLPPARLDPWVMATDPAPAQNFFFFQDPLRIVFATNATRKLIAAYGLDLFAVAKASSGNHPAGVTIPSGAVAENLPVQVMPLPGLIMSAFDGRVRELLEGEECRDFNAKSDTHELVTLNLDLEPQTDYILDLELHKPGGVVDPPPDPSVPRYRLHYTTSRYPTFNALAQAVTKAAQEPRCDRWLADIAALQALAVPNIDREREITDSELENALRNAQWGDLTRPSGPRVSGDELRAASPDGSRQPSDPRVTVIWSGDPASPTPFAVLIETPEPLWRSRGIPELVSEPPGDPDGIKRYRLVPKKWLCIPRDPGGLVSCFVYATAGDRTLIVLGPNARGATLDLVLRRTHHQLYEGQDENVDEPLLQVPLHAAPWEEPA